MTRVYLGAASDYTGEFSADFGVERFLLSLEKGLWSCSGNSIRLEARKKDSCVLLIIVLYGEVMKRIEKPLSAFIRETLIRVYKYFCIIFPNAFSTKLHAFPACFSSTISKFLALSDEE